LTLLWVIRILMSRKHVRLNHTNRAETKVVTGNCTDSEQTIVLSPWNAKRRLKRKLIKLRCITKAWHFGFDTCIFEDEATIMSSEFLEHA